VKSRDWLAVTSTLLVVGLVTAMAWRGSYNLELFFSLWILWIIVAVLLLSPRYVRPRHIAPLSLVIVVGLVAFTLIVGLHALSLLN
jgi:hypothetical protein